MIYEKEHGPMEAMIGGRNCPVRVARKRMKNMVLRVDGDTLKVSCPYGTSEQRILAFIYAKEAWILETRLRQKQNAAINQEGVGGPVIYWLGERKYVRYLQDTHDHVTVSGDLLTFWLREETDERIQKAFRKAAEQELLKMAAAQRGEWDDKICRAAGLPLPMIRIRFMTSRWGVNHIAAGRITLSTRLIHYPPEGFAYVLLHEYAHFLVPNHSSAFYRIIEQYMPQYRENDAVLKK